VPTPFQLDRPWSRYGIWLAFCGVIFWKPLLRLAEYALHNSEASHILLIPWIAAWLVYTERRKIVAGRTDLAAAMLVLVPALALGASVLLGAIASPIDSLSAVTLSFVLFLIAGFICFFGRATAKRMRFPLAFLLLIVPLPEGLLGRVIYWLQAGSSDVAEVLFDWSGTPILRDGFVFRLPSVSIEVAKECSGIRSSMALLILALLVAHFSFTKLWKQAVFVVAGLLLMLVKNGIRIATLTLLATYVNPDFLHGSLHRDGGVVFFLIGLALLWPVYWLLRRGEPVAATTPGAPASD